MTPETPEMDELAQEVWRVVGGDFTPDSIGPERYAAQVARVRERPGAYLDAFESMLLGTKFDAELQSEIHPEALLRIAAEVDPDRTRAIADQLLRQLDAVMLIPDEASDSEALFSLLSEETANVSRRLEQRRAQLRSLLS
jgi:hypothetical protein